MHRLFDAKFKTELIVYRTGPLFNPLIANGLNPVKVQAKEGLFVYPPNDVVSRLARKWETGC